MTLEPPDDIQDWTDEEKYPQIFGEEKQEVKMDVNDMIKDMEAYRQGFEEGRNNAIQSFLPLLERMCLDIDLIKKRIIPEPPKESKELAQKGTHYQKEETANKDGKYNCTCQCGCSGKSEIVNGICNPCSKGKHAKPNAGA